jgi:hypothetical protein
VYLELHALDGYRTSLLLEDALAPNVLLADHMDGGPLPIEHGAPLRLVAPDLYGYKRVKHLATIEPWLTFRPGPADRQTRAHPRGRVALEERGRGLPGWMYRRIYRALFPPTLCYYRRMEKRARSIRNPLFSSRKSMAGWTGLEPRDLRPHREPTTYKELYGVELNG